MIDGSRCPRCERVASPPEPRCLHCRAETEATELTPTGRVLTYTRQERWIALVELAEEARVLARFDAEPAIGDEVRLSPAAIVQAPR